MKPVKMNKYRSPNNESKLTIRLTEGTNQFNTSVSYSEGPNSPVIVGQRKVFPKGDPDALDLAQVEFDILHAEATEKGWFLKVPAVRPPKKEKAPKVEPLPTLPLA